MSKTFSKDIIPMCGHCVHGLSCNNTDVVVCGKKGIMDRRDSCKKFKYDPLGRTPDPLPQIERYDKSDFEL